MISAAEIIKDANAGGCDDAVCILSQRTRQEDLGRREQLFDALALGSESGYESVVRTRMSEEHDFGVR
ncbi:unnamed protein product [Gongylonema pulchrum]|uniref:Resolvase/invertase-type recombinase catalytic domain-containing protein n=1 Tax=Gongylonema pulchrum TaxID=637853 RepID=A0A183EBM2_9BILA|nr:unnamed protein product [Gongylonema pulchrum]